MMAWTSPTWYSRHHRVSPPIWMVLGILASLLLAACGSQAGMVAVATPTSEPSPTPIPAEIIQIQAKLKAGPHGIGYDLGRGPNTYCSRCHSPQNWDPASKVDPPPNCVSCKFPMEDKPRQAVSNPLVPIEDWKGISCEVCHLAHEGQIDAQIGWLDVTTGYHNTVTSSTELCNKCHTDTETLKHHRSLGEEAHANFTCTQCHEPHSATADCSTAGCHPALEAPASSHPGFDPEHKNVKCIACHDASGLAAGPTEDGQFWTVYRKTSLLGRTSSSPYQSHTLQKQVDCTRCHYPDNPWNLTLVEATPAP